MSSAWGDQFATWARPLSDTETTRCENAEGMIVKALNTHDVLSAKNIRVFVQGSFRNGTNVRAESDVDIAVCCDDIIYTDYQLAPTLNDSIVGLQPADYTSYDMRRDVGQALLDYFGSAGVTAGTKAFNVHENSYRVDADVVPCIEHRLYISANQWHSGTAIYPTIGNVIVNWPQQNYDNGVEKNRRTNTNFKQLVRVIKNLRNTMADERIAAAKPIPSYLIECLVWNVPDVGFAHSSYYDDVRFILAHLYENTTNDDGCREWGEENEMKYLFRANQPWTRQQVNAFVVAAWNYVGFN